MSSRCQAWRPAQRVRGSLACRRDQTLTERTVPDSRRRRSREFTRHVNPSTQRAPYGQNRLSCCWLPRIVQRRPGGAARLHRSSPPCDREGNWGIPAPQPGQGRFTESKRSPAGVRIALPIAPVVHIDRGHSAPPGFLFRPECGDFLPSWFRALVGPWPSHGRYSISVNLLRGFMLQDDARAYAMPRRLSRSGEPPGPDRVFPGGASKVSHGKCVRDGQHCNWPTNMRLSCQSASLQPDPIRTPTASRPRTIADTTAMNSSLRRT